MADLERGRAAEGRVEPLAVAKILKITGTESADNISASVASGNLTAKAGTVTMDVTKAVRETKAGKAPDTLLKRMSVAGHGVPGHYHLKDIPSPVWPPPVERGDYVTQAPAPQPSEASS